MTRQDGGTRERLIRLALIIVVLGGALAVGRRASADPCPETYEFTADQLGTWLDFGSEGFLHDVRLSSDTKVTLQVQSCPNAEKPCGVCTLSGLIRNRFADAGDVLNQRCTNNPARACTNDGECGQQCLGGGERRGRVHHGGGLSRAVVADRNPRRHVPRRGGLPLLLRQPDDDGNRGRVQRVSRDRDHGNGDRVGRSGEWSIHDIVADAADHLGRDGYVSVSGVR